MKLEVGMYVRTIKGKIRKIISLSFDKEWKSVFVETHTWLKEEHILKASHNIIDLIEIGDYVNSHLVRAVYLDGVRKYIKLDNSHSVENNFAGVRTYEEDIKSIVTKEQFESMGYKVGR